MAKNKLKKSWRSHIFWTYAKNKYVLIIMLFAAWMLFLDSNSWLTHLELNNEIEALEENKKYYEKEIVKDQKVINKLNDSQGLEHFAREEYFMKKENEEIYIIEYEDSLDL